VKSVSEKMGQAVSGARRRIPAAVSASFDALCCALKIRACQHSLHNLV
jgi:hypothetical protein